MRTISDSWYRVSDELQCMHGFGTELIRNLAIWLAVSQDYHLFIYKVYWYILSMFVPIFTSFGIENASLHSGRPRKLLPLISLSYFFLFHDPRVSTRGIASIINWTPRNKLQWNFNRNSYIFIQENAHENVVCKMASILSRPQCVKPCVMADNGCKFCWQVLRRCLSRSIGILQGSLWLVGLSTGAAACKMVKMGDSHQ